MMAKKKKMEVTPYKALDQILLDLITGGGTGPIAEDLGTSLYPQSFKPQPKPELSNFAKNILRAVVEYGGGLSLNGGPAQQFADEYMKRDSLQNLSPNISPSYQPPIRYR